MTQDFQAGPPRAERERDLEDDRDYTSIRKPNSGLPAWGWALIAVVLLFFVCSGATMVAALGIFFVAQPSPAPAPVLAPLSPVQVEKPPPPTENPAEVEKP
jgi:hypothetical protein